MSAPLPVSVSLPTRAARRYNTLKRAIAITAATAAAVGAGILFKACGDSEPHTGKQAPKAECIDTSAQAAKHDKILADLARAATEKTLKWDRKTAEQTAQKNSLHLADTRLAKERIWADKSLAGSAVAAKVDGILAHEYNVRLGYGDNVSADRLEGSTYVLTALAPYPTKLVDAAVDKIDIVNGSINSPMVDYVNEKPVGGFTPGAPDRSIARYAWMRAGYYPVESVVFGMGLHAAACTNPAEDSQFTKLNPVGFKYGKKTWDDPAWQGVTTSAVGAESAESDYASVTEALLGPTYDECVDIAGSEVLQKKIALVVYRATALTAPGMEDYLAREFFGECAENIAAGTTYVPDFN